MTAHKILELSCDHEGCTATFHGVTDNSMVKVRQAAKRGGWKYVPGHPAAPHPAGRDFCPAHTPSVLAPGGAA